MLDFRQKKAPKGVRFTLNRAEMLRSRGAGSADKRRIFHLCVLIAVAVISAGLLWSFIDKISNALIPATDQLKHEIPLPVMARPSMESLPALPDAAAIAAQRESAANLLAENANPLWAGQPDAGGLAWMQVAFERDQSTPPLPQRVTARDLVLNHVRVGSAVLLSGMLEDSQPAPVAGQERGYQRLLLSLEKDQYVEVIAPATAAADLLIGKEVQVVGRYLGPATIAAAAPADDGKPTVPPAPGAPASAPPVPATAPAPAAAAQVRLPLIAARVAFHAAERKSDDDNPYVMRGAWNPPADLYANVDDDLLILETRPYYFTIGQVNLDRTTPGALANAQSANKEAALLHRKPADYRGKPFTVHGHVFHAWEDEGVAKDQPFGVGRVVRAILWSEDWGPYDVTDATGKVTTSNKLVLRAFEIAAVTHQPLPKPGDILFATGRFLRMRAMEVKPNERRDRALGVTRQSDRAFTFMFVTQGWEDVEPPIQYDLTWAKVGLVLAAILLAALLLNMARKESNREELVFDSVRKLRQSRGELKGRKGESAKSEGDAAIAPSSSPPPEAAAPPAPPADVPAPPTL